jgi:hypothetical protein
MFFEIRKSNTAKSKFGTTAIKDDFPIIDYDQMAAIRRAATTASTSTEVGKSRQTRSGAITTSSTYRTVCMFALLWFVRRGLLIGRRPSGHCGSKPSRSRAWAIAFSASIPIWVRSANRKPRLGACLLLLVRYGEQDPSALYWVFCHRFRIVVGYVADITAVSDLRLWLIPQKRACGNVLG